MALFVANDWKSQIMKYAIVGATTFGLGYYYGNKNCKENRDKKIYSQLEKIIENQENYQRR